MGGFEIRDACVADYSVFAAIYNEAIESRRATMDTEPIAAGYFETYRADDQALLAAVLDGEPLGWGIVKRYSDRPGYRVACETSLYFYAEHTGQGYGGRLLDALVERAAALAYAHLVAKILAVNKASVRFHERHGFEVVGIQRRIGKLDGHWQDVVILQRILADSRSRRTRA